jgi:spore coat polysaccharide biosynthesis protein SpsF
VLAILQARTSSRRLPGKVLKPIVGRPMIGLQIERLRRSRRLTGLVVATSSDPSDDILAEVAASEGANVYRGALDDVLTRFRGALRSVGDPKSFLRLTADCPLADPDVVDLCIDHHVAGDFEYTHNSLDWTFPKGLDVEVVERAAFERVAEAAHETYQREHVTPYFYQHPEQFRIGRVRRDPPLRFRWTVDTPKDLAFVTAVYEDLYLKKPDFRMADILAWQEAHPGLVLPHDLGAAAS